MLTDHLDQQRSGNIWEPQVAQRAYRAFQQTATVHQHPEQHNILADLEWQMIAHEAEFSDTLDSLKKRFIFVNSTAVQEFLRKNRSLAPLLMDALPHLVNSFGSQTPLALDLLSEETDARIIYAIALCQASAANSRAALGRFDDLWLIPNLSKINGRIVFTYEFV
jgi:hypothetical protein